MIKMKTNVKPGKTPEKITVSMIDEDLNNGITKPEMAIKYDIKLWEIAEMFKHPLLKGRRPSKKKPLSFIFEDDMTDAVDPNQIDLEDAIDEAIDTIEEAKETIEEVLDETEKMLSQSDWKAEDSKTGDKIELDQGAQEMLNECLDTMVNEDGETLRETFDKEIAAGNAPEEEELEMDDDTFEL